MGSILDPDDSADSLRGCLTLSNELSGHALKIGHRLFQNAFRFSFLITVPFVTKQLVLRQGVFKQRKKENRSEKFLNLHLDVVVLATFTRRKLDSL
jgi:hypothetical protein